MISCDINLSADGHHFKSVPGSVFRSSKILITANSDYNKLHFPVVLLLFFQFFLKGNYEIYRL